MGLVYGTLYHKDGVTPLAGTITFTKSGIVSTAVADSNGNYSKTLAIGTYTVKYGTDACTPSPINVPAGSLYRDIVNTVRGWNVVQAPASKKKPRPKQVTEIHWYWPIDEGAEISPKVVNQLQSGKFEYTLNYSVGVLKDNTNGGPEVTRDAGDAVLVVWCLDGNAPPKLENKGWKRMSKRVGETVVGKEKPAKKPAPKKAAAKKK